METLLSIIMLIIMVGPAIITYFVCSHANYSDLDIFGYTFCAFCDSGLVLGMVIMISSAIHKRKKGNNSNSSSGASRSSSGGYSTYDYEERRRGDAALHGRLYGDFRIDDDDEYLVDQFGARRRIESIDSDGLLHDEFGQVHLKSIGSWDRDDNGDYWFNDENHF